ncbi:MAG: FISUMP domain-containing protein [Salinivirgaceae bacterium]
MKKTIIILITTLFATMGISRAQEKETFFSNHKNVEFIYEGGAMDIGAKGYAKVIDFKGNLIGIEVTYYLMGPDYFKKQNPKTIKNDIEYKDGLYKWWMGDNLKKGRVTNGKLSLYGERGEWIFIELPKEVIEAEKNGANNQNTVKDGDGNTYQTVVIGNQEWMTENLRTTKYNDGTPIENLVDANAWVATKSGAYCWYNNDKTNALEKNYGALYNWYAVNTEKLCPAGWHVPDYDEWLTLAKTANKDKAALKATTGWKQDQVNTGNGNNTYGFAATPAGTRAYKYGVFSKAEIITQFWTTKEFGSDQVLLFTINNNPKPINTNLKFSGNKYDGLSVRCMRNVSDDQTPTTKQNNNYIKIQNNWKKTFLNIENGMACSEIAPGWHSAMWIIEPSEGNYVKIKNRWKGTYLHIEGGLAVQCTEIQPGWHSAMWLIEPIEGTNQVRIKNRWKNTYLNIESGSLHCTDIAPGWLSARWDIVKVNE